MQINGNIFNKLYNKMIQINKLKQYFYSYRTIYGLVSVDVNDICNKNINYKKMGFFFNIGNSHDTLQVIIKN